MKSQKGWIVHEHKFEMLQYVFFDISIIVNYQTYSMDFS